MKPLIGLNLDVTAGPPRRVDMQVTYYESIFKAGGIPILLPPMPKEDLEIVLDHVAGIVLIGGNDYSPKLYGESVGANFQPVDQMREEFDWQLIRSLMERPQMPVLGICGGCQLLNIAFGGTLIQDIPTELPDSKVKHKGEAGWKMADWEEIEIEAGSQLFSIYKKSSIKVPTAHHQAVKTLGTNLRCAARAEDGVIEAVEATDRPFAIGVEWHPERDLAVNEPLFKEFIAHAKVLAKTCSAV